MKSFIALLKASARHYTLHNASRMGAALSYYAIFSIAPLTILVIALVGSIFGTQLAESSIVTELDRVIGSGAGDFIEAIINSTLTRSLGTFATLVSIATILFGLINSITVLDASLDELWETVTVTERKGSFITRLGASIKGKFPAFSLVPLMALLFLFFVAVSVFLTLFQDDLSTTYAMRVLIGVVEPVALFIFGTAFFAFIYRVLPGRKISTRAILLGSAFTSFLFLLGRLMIGYYIAGFVHTTLYGAAASLVALLIWVYYSSQAFFYGASFTYLYARRTQKV